MTNPTPLQQLVGLKLGEDLDAFVAERRKVVIVQRPTHSWAEVAAEIERRTGIKVTRETLRSWYAADADDAAA